MYAHLKLDVGVNTRQQQLGEPILFHVRLRNDGVQGRHENVMLSCHLYDAKGSLLRWDMLRREVGYLPGFQETVVLGYELEPLPVGQYILEFDLVCEGRFWFSERGLGTARIALQIAALYPLCRPNYQSYGVAPGDSAVLAQQAYRTREYAMAQMLAEHGLGAQPDAPELWELLSHLAEERGEPAYARDLLAVALSLCGTAASSASRYRLLELTTQSACPRSWPVVPRTGRPLRILFVAEHMAPAVGGAEYTAWFLLRFAAAAGHQVSIVTIGEAGFPQDGSRVRLERATSREQVWSVLGRQQADVVLSQGRLSPTAGKWAVTQHIPHMVFVQSYELLCHYPLSLHSCHRQTDQCPCLTMGFQAATQTLAGARRIFAASRYVAEVITRITGQQAEVFHQLIDFARIAPYQRQPGRFIVMNQADVHKGIALFAALACRLPSETFVTVGHEAWKSDTVANLFHLGTIPQSLLYAITDILLVPSRWPEPFGRVILEAMAAGVPVVAAHSGSIKDVAGDAAILIDKQEDVAEWTDAIISLRVATALRAELIARGKQRVQLFDPFQEAQRLMGLIESGVA